MFNWLFFIKSKEFFRCLEILILGNEWMSLYGISVRPFGWILPQNEGDKTS